jgi:hypothetical protein
LAHDIGKFARLMTNRNGCVLEQIFSPLVVLSTPAHEELIELGKVTHHLDRSVACPSCSV